MTLKELIGITLYSLTLEEALTAIYSEVESDDIPKLVACAHGVGHLARRFHFKDDFLIKKIEFACSKHKDDYYISGALVDMYDDLDHFVKLQ